MKISFRPQARAEILESTDWYERQSPGLGTAFAEAVQRALSTIAKYPNAFSPVGRGARRYVLRRFPYAIIYRQQGDSVVVYSCLHGRRDPRLWKARL